MSMFEWNVMRNTGCYQVWRQTRPLRSGEPMHSGVREIRGCFETEEAAKAYADELNGKAKEGEGGV